MLPKFQYLGYVISAEGLHPAVDKILAIIQAPATQHLAQLRSFLGMFNYYGKLLHQLSSQLAPLYSLLQKGTKWHWREEQEKAFQESLISPTVLAHYGPKEELQLSCDASPYGVGTVLSEF